MDNRLLITPLLLIRFQLEGQQDGADGRYYAFIRTNEGEVLEHNPGAPEIAAEQQVWARDVLSVLNRRYHHDGAWVVVFTHPIPRPIDCILANMTTTEYGRYAIIWIDEDGDPQFTIEWERGAMSDLIDFTAVLIAGIDQLIAKCESAWELWNFHMRTVLQPHKNQLFKRAQGQAPPSTGH